MANTNCDIFQWIAQNTERAEALRNAGGAVNEAAELSMLLAGVLAEFKNSNNSAAEILKTTFLFQMQKCFCLDFFH